MRYRRHKVDINLFRSELWLSAPDEIEPPSATHNGYEFDCARFMEMGGPQRWQEVEDFLPEDSDSIQVKEREECPMPGVPFFKHDSDISVGALYDVLISRVPLPKPVEAYAYTPPKEVNENSSSEVAYPWAEDSKAAEILHERAREKARKTAETLRKFGQDKLQKKLEREVERAKKRFKLALGIVVETGIFNCVLCSKEITTGHVWDDQHVCNECMDNLRRQIEQEDKDKSVRELVCIGAIDEHQMRPISEQQSQAHHCFSCGAWMRGSKHKYCCDACWALSENLRR
jgi:hypothetical protein